MQSVLFSSWKDSGRLFNEMIKVSFMLSNNLGDGVYISSLLKARKEVEIELFFKPDRLGTVFHTLYKNLCKCSFYETYEQMKEAHPDAIESHHAIRAHGKNAHMPRLLLDYFGLFHINEIPEIPIDIADKYASLYFVRQFKDPIILMPANCGSGDPENCYAQYRTPPFEFFQNIVDKYKSKHDFLQFGISPNTYRDGYSNFFPIKGTIKILDLPVDILARIYSVVGKMISGDTGDAHLMVAVGGRVKMLVPRNDDVGYQHKYLHYNPSSWKGVPRVEYIGFERLGRLDRDPTGSILNF